MKIRDIGIKEVHYAGPSMSLRKIASMMKRHNTDIIPVCEGKNCLGY